jgi:hypothetical protein
MPTSSHSWLRGSSGLACAGGALSSAAGAAGADDGAGASGVADAAGACARAATGSAITAANANPNFVPRPPRTMRRP